MDFNSMSDKELREYLKSNGVKFFPGANRETLLKKAQDFVPPIPLQQSEPDVPPEAASTQEDEATVNVATITPILDVSATAPVTPVFVKPLPTYDPETHIVVNRKRFEQLIWNLTQGRMKMYHRGAIHTRLVELLDLESEEEARKFQTEMFNRVMAA